MSIVDICKRNAIIYSNEICKAKEGTLFPDYIDWSDHIASDDSEEYTYHLNKTVSDIEKLVQIIKHRFSHDA